MPMLTASVFLSPGIPSHRLRWWCVGQVRVVSSMVIIRYSRGTVWACAGRCSPLLATIDDDSRAKRKHLAGILLKWGLNRHCALLQYCCNVIVCDNQERLQQYSRQASGWCSISKISHSRFRQCLIESTNSCHHIKEVKASIPVDNPLATFAWIYTSW